MQLIIHPSLTLGVRYQPISHQPKKDVMNHQLATQSSATIIFLHDIYGLDQWSQNAAQRIGALGFDVVTPDLFAGLNYPSGEEGAPSTEVALQDFALKVSDAQVVATIIGALRNVESSTRIGIVGWGWSGAYALMAGAHDSRFAAIADIDGDISYANTTVNRPGSPLNFIAGIEGAFFGAFAGDDPTFPAVEVGRLRNRLIEHDKVGEVKLYPDVSRRFWSDDSLPQTVLVWKRLEEFLRGALLNEDETEIEYSTGDYPNEASRLHA